MNIFHSHSSQIQRTPLLSLGKRATYLQHSLSGIVIVCLYSEPWLPNTHFTPFHSPITVLHWYSVIVGKRVYVVIQTDIPHFQGTISLEEPSLWEVLLVGKKQIQNSFDPYYYNFFCRVSHEKFLMLSFPFLAVVIVSTLATKQINVFINCSLYKQYEYKFTTLCESFPFFSWCHFIV